MASNPMTSAGRLPPQPEEQIDRGRPIRFKFDGREVTAFEGDTIGSALTAAGVKTLSRSFKYHRPRGLLCCAGHCPNCLVQVDSEASVRSCQRPVKEGMDVRSQNAWPSLDNDIMSLTALGDRFLPAGFYYKAFVHPQALWPAYEKVLRSVSGLGRVDLESRGGAYDKQYLHADVVVVGGGPAGMSAAVSAAAEGARVLLLEENEALGGHLRYESGNGATLAQLQDEVASAETLDVLTSTTVTGWFEDNWLAAVGLTAAGTRLFKIRGRTVIVATGAVEQPLIFDNNDLPGILLGSAVQRLVNQYATAPGGSAAIVTANDDGWRVAADLVAAGIDVRAIADLRPAGSVAVADPSLAKVAVYNEHVVVAAQGRSDVTGVTIAPAADSQLDAGKAIDIPCDLLIMSMGWAPANGLLYQGGARMAYDESRAEFVPESVPSGVFAAGRANGTVLLANQITEGRLAGRRSAAFLALGPEVPAAEESDLSRAIAGEPSRTSALVQVDGRQKQFVCLCEDVSVKDLKNSIDEGFDSIELLKRYSTISMGPCQGKMCSVNTVHLCARANGRTIAETGTTTARPPVVPLSLGALAGQNLEPVRYSPVHDWHIENEARMMVAGLWLRPEHYGDPAAEVEAVRTRAGLIDVSTLGKLKFTGPGVPALLSRIYVNKWSKLPVGRVRYGLMCDDTGIILDDGVTAHVNDTEWYTTTTSTGAQSIYEWIQWWLQSGWGEGVHLTNVSENYAAFNLAGPLSREVLGKVTDHTLGSEAFPYLHLHHLEVADVACRVMRIGFTGELSYEIHCPAAFGPHVWQAIMRAGQSVDIRPFGVEAQRVLRLEKAHIIVGHDTDALSDPFSADMGWAVKLDKEDFLGNRELTRISQEDSAQKLVGFKMRDRSIVPDEGLQIVRPDSRGGLEIIGWITSCRYSPTVNETIGLCWLETATAASSGAEFLIQMDGRQLAAEVHHGPFYDIEGTRLRS